MCINCHLTDALGRYLMAPTGISRRRFVGTGLACMATSTTALPGLAQEPAEAASKTMVGGSKGPASVVFRGGAVYTLNPKQPWAEAVAVRGRYIVAVGSNAEVSAQIGETTRVIDLNGRMLLPGFVEAHIHPLVGAFFTPGVDLQRPTRNDALAAIAAHAQANRSGPVRGFGWRVDMFPPEGPNRADLDHIVPDRPAILFSIDAHSAWVNSKALEVAGITRETPDPVPGFSYYQRNAQGEPTGYVLELPAVLAIVNAIEPVTPAAITKLLGEWVPKAAAAGITAVFDAGMPAAGDDPAGLGAAYTALEAEGRLPFRVVASHIVKSGPVDDVVTRTLSLQQRYDTELVKGRVLKIVGDGTAEGYTAYMLEPYADKPDSVGQSPFSEEEWRRMIVEADAAGIDVHVHAIGDRTVRIALDCIEAAIESNPPRDRRHSIAHLVLVDETDVPRFGRLGVIAQFSGNWLSADPATVDIAIERYGPDRQRRIFRPRAILDAGGTIAFGTDWPAAGYYSTYKPLDAVQVSVTRQLIGRPDAPILEPAGQRLDLAQALRAGTLGAASQLRLDDVVGSIETGKLADLVVLRRNLFDVAPREIAATPIDMTMMNGRFTHGA